MKIGNLIFYLIILFLPTQFGKHFWPSFSLVGGIRIDYLSPTLYLTDILLGLLFVTWIFTNMKFLIFNFKFLINKQFLKKKLIKMKISLLKHSLEIRNWKLEIVVFAVVLFVGIVFSKNPFAGWYELLKLFEMVFLGWYTATHVSYKQYKTLAFLFCFPLLFESFLAIAQFFKQSSIGGLFYFFGERTFTGQTPGIANAVLNGSLALRPYGTFSHPNVLAGYLIIAMAMIISNFQFSISNEKKLFIITTLLLGTSALLLTMSRVAIVLWVIFLMIFIIRKFLKITKYLLIAAVCICSIFLLSPLFYRFSSFSLFDESIVQREFLLMQAINMIASHPIFGVGLHNFLNSLLPSSFYSTTFYLQPVHNIFFLIAAETGLVGLAVFLWFLYKTARNFQFSIFNFQIQILIIVLVLGMFDHYFLTLQQGQLLFAFVLGICWTKEKL